MNPTIESRPEFKILAMSRTFGLAGAASEIPAFWTEFYAAGHQKHACGQYGACYGYDPATETFRYAIADDYREGTEVPQGFEVLNVPANTWAVFKCIGAMPHAIQKMWERIENEWLPGSGYERVCSFDLEQYTPGDLQSPQYEAYIRLPVRKVD